MHWKLAACAALLSVSAAAAADEPPPYEGDPNWAMRALLGYTKTGGNTDNSAGNGLFHAAHLAGKWKLLFGAEGLYGSTQGETTAQAWLGYLQANYNITPRLYWYVGLRYDDDRFSGFAYQEALKTGAGYEFIQTDSTKLVAQAGAGYRRLRPEILVKDDIGGVVSRTELDPSSDAVFDGALTFEHSFNAVTKLLAAATVQSGQLNTLTTANVALQVKMSNRLALAVGYTLRDNSNPPPGSGHRDTLSTLSLVYETKNPKLAAE
jgi:putative salt-induced outer membrane protein YdiY